MNSTSAVVSGLPKVLVIEDNFDIARAVRTVLEEAGLQVIAALDGGTGLVSAREHRPDLVIVDLGLPDMDGEQVIRRLRTFSLVPVLVLTATDLLDRKVSVFAAGADDYLTKPFHEAELVARVRVQLRPMNGAGITSIGPLAISSGDRRCYYEGSEVSLSEKEFDLMNLLASQPGRVYTREEISRKLSEGRDASSNVVDVHISNLRGKLRALGGYGLIRTVRGIGFSLKAPRPTVGSPRISPEKAGGAHVDRRDF